MRTLEVEVMVPSGRRFTEGVEELARGAGTVREALYAFPCGTFLYDTPERTGDAEARIAHLFGENEVVTCRQRY